MDFYYILYAMSLFCVSMKSVSASTNATTAGKAYFDILMFMYM